MPSSSEHLLVLAKTKLGETDLIITGINPHGVLIRAVAKGARKPGSRLGSSLELFMLSDVLIAQGKSLGIVTEARIAVSNQECRKEFEVTACASVVCELVEKLCRDADPEARFFDLPVKALRCLGLAKGAAVRLIAAAAAFKLIAFAGYMPVQESCLIEGKPLDYKAIKSALYSRFEELSEFSDDGYTALASTLLADLEVYLKYHLELRLKSLEVLLAC